MPRVVTASLLALVLYPHAIQAQGTRLWVQSRYEEFEKGQPESTAISSRGYLEAGPALKSVLLTPSTYIWDVASDSQIFNRHTRVEFDDKSLTERPADDHAEAHIVTGGEVRIHAARKHLF